MTKREDIDQEFECFLDEMDSIKLSVRRVSESEPLYLLFFEFLTVIAMQCAVH